MRTIALLVLLSMTACAGIPFVEDSGVSQLTVRELSALEGIPGGYVPAERSNYLRRSGEMALVPADDGPGLTPGETVALESVFGAYGRTDEREAPSRSAATRRLD